MIILDYLLLFFIGSLVGWIIELVFRRFISAKRWVNPGFLTGPYIPLYGFGTCFLYLFSHVNVFENNTYNLILIVFLSGTSMTLIEYIAGFIFIKFFNIKLWDYSNRKFNIGGIICPLFSLIWYLVSFLYMLILNEGMHNLTGWFDSNLAFGVVVGFYYGIFFVDLLISFNVNAKISKLAKNNKIILSYEQFKIHIKEKAEELKDKQSFLFPFKSKSYTFTDLIDSYTNKIKDEYQIFKQKMEEKRKAKNKND